MSGPSLRSRGLKLLVFAVLAIVVFWVYRVFIHDPYPHEAIEFFYPAEQIGVEENAIYSIAGLAAPLGTADSREWGYRKILQNWQRYRDEQNRTPILSAWEGLTDYPRLRGIDRKKLHCWLPDSAGRNPQRDCYSRAELAEIIASNAEQMARYEAMFAYPRIDTQEYYGVNLTETLAYSDLFALQFRLRLDRLDAADYSRIFRFFRFWEKLAARPAVSSTDHVILLFNYRKATGLISEIAQLDPQILRQYRREYGDFETPVDAQQFIDATLRQEFYQLDRYLCLRAYFELADDCNAAVMKVPTRLGEMTRRIHARRPRAEDCPRAVEQQDEVVKKPGYWELLWRDPGNVGGNILLMTVANNSQLCKLLQFYLLEAEANILRNRYLELTAAGSTPAESRRQYTEDPVIYENLFSGNRFLWDGEGNRVRWENRRYPKDYSIPL